MRSTRPTPPRTARIPFGDRSSRMSRGHCTRRRGRRASRVLDCAACDRRRAPPSAASSASCSPGTASTAATFPGAARAIRIACWCPRSCCSRRRSIGSSRSIASSSAATRSLRALAAGAGRRRAADLVPARLQRPSAAPARDRVRVVARYGGRLPDDAERLRRCPVSAATPPAPSSRSPSVATSRCSTPTCAAFSRRVFLGPRRTARLRGRPRLWELAERLVPAGRGYDFNQALMDFGATWCTPRRPRCEGCPMRGFCATGPPAPAAR